MADLVAQDRAKQVNEYPGDDGHHANHGKPMQRLVVADGKANASRREPEQEMMPPQGDSDFMTLFVLLAERLRSRLGHGVGVFTSTHALFISMPASDGRLAGANQL